jgi:hypothetical protein
LQSVCVCGCMMLCAGLANQQLGLHMQPQTILTARDCNFEKILFYFIVKTF